MGCSGFGSFQFFFCLLSDPEWKLLRRGRSGVSSGTRDAKPSSDLTENMYLTRDSSFEGGLVISCLFLWEVMPGLEQVFLWKFSMVGLCFIWIYGAPAITWGLWKLVLVTTS